MRQLSPESSVPACANGGAWRPVRQRQSESGKQALYRHKEAGWNAGIDPPSRHENRRKPRTCLGGGIRGIFRGVHVVELEPVGDNCTRLVQRETFDGLFVRFAHLDGIAEGYERMNHALKEHVEAAAASADCRA
jgi:hypothetical protein